MQALIDRAKRQADEHYEIYNLSRDARIWGTIREISESYSDTNQRSIDSDTKES